MRRSIVLLSFYNMLIYLPLIVICICGRALLPDVTPEDEIIPRLAIWSSQDWTGGSLVSGLILAAPFGAVMATVSTFLVVIASGVVRDVYQRFLRPHAGEAEIRRVSHVVMIGFGVDRRGGEHQPGRLLAKAGRVQHDEHGLDAGGAGLDAGLLAPGDRHGGAGRDGHGRCDRIGAVHQRAGVRGQEAVRPLSAIGIWTRSSGAWPLRAWPASW